VVRECALRGVLTALFESHDPQGRTPLHVAIEHWNLDIVDMFWRMMKNKEFVGGVSDEEGRACWNARDAAGRTPLHAMVVSKNNNAEYLLRIKWVDVDARVCPQHYEEWVALLHWKAPSVTLSPKYEEQEHCTAIHLAVLHNHMNVVQQLIKFPPQSKAGHLNGYLRRGLSVQNQDIESLRPWEGEYLSAIQLAASMGHINILCLLLDVCIYLF
jgi:ankyrin repeat protein